MPDSEVGSREAFTWTDAAGVTTDLGVLASGLGGRFMPPMSLIADESPGQHGSRLRDVRVKERDVSLPFAVASLDQTAQRTALRTLMRLFNPLRGEGLLRCSLDGNTRELRCRYVGGLELDESASTSTPEFQRALVVLRAHDPFWYDATAMSSTFTTGAQPLFFSSPFLGRPKLASDTVLGQQTVSNTGDVEAWPVWTVNGPATSIVLTNVTTGEKIDLPIVLTASQSVVIDTRPFKKTVRRNDGTNLFGSMINASTLWSLREGDTVINTQVAGSTSATFVTLVYSRRFLSP